MDAASANAAHAERIALFELGPAYLPGEGPLPAEKTRLAVVLAGPRDARDWHGGAPQAMDFFDLKGIVEGLTAGLRLPAAACMPADDPRFHPGRCAAFTVAGVPAGVLGELQPQIAARYDLGGRAVLAAELDFEILRAHMQGRHTVTPISDFPPVLEDLAVIVSEETPASAVFDCIRSAGGDLLRTVNLFDVYRGDQLGAGKKSLAVSLTYQSADRTLTNADAEQIRGRIIAALENSLGGKVRKG
jgi:phenylalanyl-tRNA synthetase beta chain